MVTPKRNNGLPEVAKPRKEREAVRKVVVARLRAKAPRKRNATSVA